MLKVVVSGFTGKMGKALMAKTHYKEGFKVVGGIASIDNIHLGKDLGEIANLEKTGVNLDCSFKNIPKTDVIIDFSEPSFSFEAIKYSKENGIPIVIGTTGFEHEQLSLISEVSKTIPILLSANTSLGIVFIKRLLDNLSKESLISFDEIRVWERHHKNKIDSPSGTALDLRDFLSRAVESEKKIIIDTEREGKSVGEHKISLIKENELIEISHKALNRSIFAEGALEAARWLHSQPKGLYTMSDIYS